MEIEIHNEKLLNHHKFPTIVIDATAIFSKQDIYVHDGNMMGEESEILAVSGWVRKSHISSRHSVHHTPGDTQFYAQCMPSL